MTGMVATRTSRAVRVRVRRALGTGAACIALLALGATAAQAESQTPVVQAPVVESEGAVNVTAVTATLQASVNPEYAETYYYFEYGPTATYGSTSPAPPGTRIGESGLPRSAEAAVSGLSPGVTYHFRVVAMNPNGTTNGPDQTFTTGTPQAPVVESGGESAANVITTAADLTAEIATGYLETDYQVEYGITPEYGLRAPTPEATLAAAGGTQRVVVHVESLQPNTTYYFRLVATNALGTVTASAATFTTYPPGEAFSLPDNRVYELVSPPNKNGGEVGGEQEAWALPPSALGESSASGGAITYASFTSFGDAQSAELATQYLSTRGPSGWTTHGISPPAAPANNFSLEVEKFRIFTSELTAWVFAWPHPPLTEGAPPEIESLFRGETGSGAYQLINDGTPRDAGSKSYSVEMVGASSDLRHVVFEADEAFTTGAPTGAWSVYEWTPGAPLRLVSVLPGPGEVAAASAHGAGGEGNFNRGNMLPNLVSADGSRIFWTTQ